MYSFKDKKFQISDENSESLNNFLKALDNGVGHNILRIYDDFEDDISLAGDSIATPALNDQKFISGIKDRIDLLLPIIKAGKEHLNESINSRNGDCIWVIFILENAKEEVLFFNMILDGDESVYDKSYGGFDLRRIKAVETLRPD